MAVLWLPLAAVLLPLAVGAGGRAAEAAAHRLEQQTGAVEAQLTAPQARDKEARGAGATGPKKMNLPLVILV